MRQNHTGIPVPNAFVFVFVEFDDAISSIAHRQLCLIQNTYNECQMKTRNEKNQKQTENVQ